MTQPRMFYFGPWEVAGHHFRNEHGSSIQEYKEPNFPFGNYEGKQPVDGVLQPGGSLPGDESYRRHNRPGRNQEGLALLHHIQGWTALCFWDRSVDSRYGSNSNYFAEGTFTFDEMVALAKTRFAYRWNKMDFEVRLQEPK